MRMIQVSDVLGAVERALAKHGIPLEVEELDLDCEAPGRLPIPARRG
jgi:hypothetical protein